MTKITTAITTLKKSKERPKARGRMERNEGKHFLVNSPLGGGGTVAGIWKSLETSNSSSSSSLAALLKGAGGSGLETGCASVTPSSAVTPASLAARRGSGVETGASGGKQTRLGDVSSGVVEPVVEGKG